MNFQKYPEKKRCSVCKCGHREYDHIGINIFSSKCSNCECPKFKREAMMSEKEWSEFSKEFNN